ncbi:biopolymer transporter ExbD [Tropicibacter sp. Alg240-R139]|uniref:biopolymer transporter ExbD n=1 Tax=Tropicibacter sp. Alg240-R139 TaxID=2305991 RepID=UPI001F076CA4|nr:biopolymer transporter ExbD [Tropicibacter sp. Alg240-R139]
MRNAAPFVRRSLSMTPLIDIIFLLLLFFMLSSTFSKYSEIELSNATTGGESSSEPVKRTFVQLGAERLLVNGAPMTLDVLGDSIEEGQVLVSLDQNVTAQTVIDLLVRLRGRVGLNVLVLE